MSSETPFKFLPAGEVTMPLGWFITAGMLVVSLSVGYGGYRVGFQTQDKDITEAKQEMKTLSSDVTRLSYEMGQLKQSLDDLRDTIKNQAAKP